MVLPVSETRLEGGLLPGGGGNPLRRGKFLPQSCPVLSRNAARPFSILAALPQPPFPSGLSRHIRLAPLDSRVWIRLGVCSQPAGTARRAVQGQAKYRLRAVGGQGWLLAASTRGPFWREGCLGRPHE